MFVVVAIAVTVVASRGDCIPVSFGGNPLSEVLRKRLGDLPAPSSVGNIDWRRREKDEHEWVTNSLGFSLRLNKIEYYKEVGTCWNSKTLVICLGECCCWCFVVGSEDSGLAL